MTLYGLIGYPLSHSRSPELFKRIFAEKGCSDREYRLFPVSDLDNLRGIIANHPGLRGFNVTSPWKEKIITYLDELDDTARQIGAVNTVVVSRKGSSHSLKGFNTDAAGFRDSGNFSGFSRALILGTGGAAKAVAFALRQLGTDILFVSRNTSDPDTIRYPEINSEILGTRRLVINATPLGTYPDTESCPPIPYPVLTPANFLYDLVYNPPLSTFLKKGAQSGARTQNGERMLQLQAEESWRIWQGE